MSTILIVPSKPRQFDKDSSELYLWKSVHGIQEFMIFHNYRAALLQIFGDLVISTSTCQGSGLHWPPFPGLPGPRGHSIVKNTGGWLDSLWSGILVGKDILGFFKNIDLDNS